MLLFRKMQALGNDILIIDSMRYPEWAQMPFDGCMLANRHLGIGYDQAIFVYPPESGEVSARYEVINQDGSSAMQCLNGLRCLGHYWLNDIEPERSEVHFMSPSGPVSVAQEENRFTTINPWPTAVTEQASTWRDHPVYRVEVGNEHHVIFCDRIEKEFATLCNDWISGSNGLNKDMNCMMAQIQDDTTLRLMALERGCGPTLACGSGAVATVAAAMANERLDSRATITVSLPLGELDIRFDEHHARCTGPVTPVFTGTLHGQPS